MPPGNSALQSSSIIQSVEVSGDTVSRCLSIVCLSVCVSLTLDISAKAEFIS